MGWTDLKTSSGRNPARTRRIAARDDVVAAVDLLLFSACGTAMTQQTSLGAMIADAFTASLSGFTAATVGATSSDAVALVGV